MDDVLLVNNLFDGGLVVVVLLGQTLGGRQAVGREGRRLRSHDDTRSDEKTGKMLCRRASEEGLLRVYARLCRDKALTVETVAAPAQPSITGRNAIWKVVKSLYSRCGQGRRGTHKELDVLLVSKDEQR